MQLISVVTTEICEAIFFFIPAKSAEAARQNLYFCRAASADLLPRQFKRMLYGARGAPHKKFSKIVAFPNIAKAIADYYCESSVNSHHSSNNSCGMRS